MTLSKPDKEAQPNESRRRVYPMRAGADLRSDTNWRIGDNFIVFARLCPRFCIRAPMM